MNNQFVKDSLLPDEKIIATAKFHIIKSVWFPAIVAVGLLTLFIFQYVDKYDTTFHKCHWSQSYIDLSNSYAIFWNSENDNKIYGYEIPSDEWSAFREALSNEAFRKAFAHSLVNRPTHRATHIGSATSSAEFREFLDKKVKYNYNFDNSEFYQDGASIGSIIGCLIGIILICGVLFKILSWINSKDEFVITNKRVVAKVGVIRRVSFELLIEQVESIEVHQGIIGRLLKYGTEKPCGVGASKVRIPFVVNPFEFRQHFYDLKKPQNN